MRERTTCSRATVTAAILILATLWSSGAYAAPYRDGEILVRYKPGAQAQVRAAATAVGATLAQDLAQIRTHRLRLPHGLSVQDAVARFRKNPRVEYAGPNHIVRICQTLEPDDEYYTVGFFSVFRQWGLYDPDYPGAGIDAPKAWYVNTGSPSIVIAIVDTGIDALHEDLYAKVVTGRNTILGEDPENTDDDQGHGTFVAGIAGAMTNNWIGVAGVSWGSMLMPVKVIGASGEGTEADAAAGIIWAADHGAHVINMSFGGYDDVQAEKDAVEYAWNRGCVLVGASGNDGSGDLFYPASYEQVLAVGASNESAQRCTAEDWLEGGSNYGSYLDVMAPGNNILSTAPTSGGLFGPYEISSGTSAAAPFVSGIAALILSKNTGWTNAQVVTQVKTTCVDMDITGWDIMTGWGLVNAFNALVNAPMQSRRLGELAHLPNGAFVKATDAVITSGSSAIPGRIYLEQTDRASGILLPYTTPPSGYAEGDIVEATGVLATVDGERALQGASLTKLGTMTPLRPLGMPTRFVGGTQLGSKPGIDGGTGLNNMSLLVTVWGRVTGNFQWTYFYVDDGSMLSDGSGLTGVKVICGGIPKPPLGAYVRVTGISSCEQPAGTGLTIPAIRVRGASDVVRLY